MNRPPSDPSPQTLTHRPRFLHKRNRTKVTPPFINLPFPSCNVLTAGDSIAVFGVGIDGRRWRSAWRREIGWFWRWGCWTESLRICKGVEICTWWSCADIDVIDVGGHTNCWRGVQWFGSVPSQLCSLAGLYSIIFLSVIIHYMLPQTILRKRIYTQSDSRVFRNTKEWRLESEQSFYVFEMKVSSDEKCCW